MPRLTVIVYDEKTKIGVPFAEVHLFEGGGGVEPPEAADYKGYTDSEGKAVFEVYGFFRVGIIARGYESAHEPHIPPGEWKHVWTCWGAVGVARDIDYPFAVRSVAPPTWMLIPASLPVLFSVSVIACAELQSFLAS